MIATDELPINCTQGIVCMTHIMQPYLESLTCDAFLPCCCHAAGHYTEMLDAVLKHDSRRISKLISCVGYTNNAAVQVEAIRITQFFAARQPTLADMLVQQQPTTGTMHAYCLPYALLQMQAPMNRMRSVVWLMHE